MYHKQLACLFTFFFRIYCISVLLISSILFAEHAYAMIIAMTFTGRTCNRVIFFLFISAKVGKGTLIRLFLLLVFHWGDFSSLPILETKQETRKNIFQREHNSYLRVIIGRGVPIGGLFLNFLLE